MGAPAYIQRFPRGASLLCPFCPQAPNHQHHGPTMWPSTVQTRKLRPSRQHLAQGHGAGQTLGCESGLRLSQRLFLPRPVRDRIRASPGWTQHADGDQDWASCAWDSSRVVVGRGMGEGGDEREEGPSDCGRAAHRGRGGGNRVGAFQGGACGLRKDELIPEDTGARPRGRPSLRGGQARPPPVLPASPSPPARGPRPPGPLVGAPPARTPRTFLSHTFFPPGATK